MDILSFIFPKNCFSCGKKGFYVCPECISKSERSQSICPECGYLSFLGRTHDRCRRTYGLDGLISIWKYRDPIKKIIFALKYKYITDLAEELTNYVVFELRKKPLRLNKVVLVPIPLYEKKLLWRGFNQTEILGEKIAQNMGWKFAPNLLVKRFSTPPQVGLDKQKRKVNIKGVFEFNTNRYPVPRDSCLIIFDDVYTTGSTIKEAGKVLKKAKFEKVWGLTITR